VSPRWNPGDVGQVHVDIAARPPSRSIGAFTDSVTRGPRPPLTPAEEAEDELQRLRASRWVARMSMLRAHGCRGRSCPKLAHAADRDRHGGPAAGGEGMTAVLEMLGLRLPAAPYPAGERTRGRTGGRYAARGPGP